MGDLHGVEAIGFDIGRVGFKVKCILAHKGQQAAAPAAPGAIAIDGVLEIAFNLETDLAAMAASGVQHMFLLFYSK
jgi:hypothetical protein